MIDPSLLTPNTRDELHCSQATLINAWRLMTGETLTMAFAEAITGYRAGVETWIYGALRWLGEQGCVVIHIDPIPTEVFGPGLRIGLISAGIDAESVDYICSITDTEQEADFIAEAKRTSLVAFETRVPRIEDIVAGLDDGCAVLVSVDLGVLNGQREGYESHSVLVTESDGPYFVIQDPGPPARWNWSVPAALLAQAMASPTEASGMVTLVYPPNANVQGGGDDDGIVPADRR